MSSIRVLFFGLAAVRFIGLGLAKAPELMLRNLPEIKRVILRSYVVYDSRYYSYSFET